MIDSQSEPQIDRQTDSQIDRFDRINDRSIHKKYNDNK